MTSKCELASAGKSVGGCLLLTSLAGYALARADHDPMQASAGTAERSTRDAMGKHPEGTPMRFIRTLYLAVATLLFSLPPSSAEVVGVAIAVAPPPIPVYVQPPIPGPGYIWVPGYWAWGDDDYYWVPGTWVLAPTVGYLWTPGYWYWRDTGYYWRAGYWGPRVGFYGGVNYGCGYYGTGYVGGHWKGRVFAYNTAVTNIGTTR